MLRKQGNFGKGRRFRPKYCKEHKERIVCYGCKKPRNFRVECPKQVKQKHEKDRNKKFHKKKSFMSTWEDLDSLMLESDEEADVGPMADTANTLVSNEFDEEVDFFALHSV